MLLSEGGGIAWGGTGPRVCMEQVLVEVRAPDGYGAAMGALRWHKNLPQDKMRLSRVCYSPRGN